MSEDELIKGLKLQSRAAYEQAYLTYKDVVFRSICKYVSVMEDAEELLQDVFVKAFKKIDQFNGHSRLSTWLVKIAINASLNFLQSIKTQKALIVTPADLIIQEEDEDQEAVSDLPTPEELMLKKEGREILISAFTKLSADQHTACKLFYLEGFPQLEIAEIMNMSLDAVQSLIQRGKIKLRTILKSTQINLSV